MTLNKHIFYSTQNTFFELSFLKFFPEKFLLLKHNIFSFKYWVKIIEIIRISVQRIEESKASFKVLNWNY